MNVTLSSQEVINAITVYMALKGFKTGECFDFNWQKYSGLESVDIEIENANFDLNKIQEFARKY